ncbi:MAG: DNA-directed RNA polymerase subunit D [Candidatus Micrarchaeales archaeon]|nr:DNA-directed RNA polymerase subunit D [Candidatus Micrarchaeales archaeon]
MKIEAIEATGNALRFTLKDAIPGYANAVRRASARVPTFAIDKITMYENTSAMFDEYISHRIGLVPITTPAKGYSEKDEVIFNLDATGPKTVYSGELETSDKDVKVANAEIPLIKLGEGQRVRLEGKALLGTSSRHAKFQAGLVTYEQKNDTTYAFYVEGFGQMPPKEIVNKTFEVIKEELKELEKEAKKL